MSTYDYDFFVVGAGSGGTRAARVAAGHGVRVGVAEDTYLGGTCVNVGCVPKKLLTYGAHFAEDLEDAAGYGWTVGDCSHSWARMVANKNIEIERLNGIYEHLIKGAGADIHWGRARLIDRHTVDVGGRRITAEKILIAVGGWPFVPDFAGSEHVITSNDAFHLPELPKRILIVGGGYIAVEFAGIFHGLGARVTQLYRGALFLRGFDDDVRTFLAQEMIKKGIDLRFDVEVRSITKKDNGAFLVDLTNSGTVETDLVMYATGRKPNTLDLGHDAAGVALDAYGAVVVGSDWRTNVDNIYAVGDVTNRIQLTPVAIQEGHALADALFHPSGKTVSYEYVPSAVFSNPEIGTVGYTEAEARARYGGVDIYRSTYKPMKYTMSGRDARGLMKLVVARDTQRVVGLHVVGPSAGEMTQGFAVAIKMGATKQDFDATIGIHPTAAEELVTMRTPVPNPERQAVS